MKIIVKAVLIPLLIGGIIIWAIFGVMDGGTATRNSYIWLIGIIIALVFIAHQFDHIKLNDKIETLKEQINNK